MKLDILNTRHRMVLLQLLGWGVIIATTLLWSLVFGDGALDGFGMITFVLNIFTMIVLYMFNYIIFIPRLLFRDKHSLFVVANLLIIFVLLFGSYSFNNSDLLEYMRPDNAPLRPRANHNQVYLARDFINYILLIGLVTAMRLAERLEESQKALQAAESARVKAELDNLRSQINPHFLLNTLNNIYALTEIDTQQAQQTIQELSNLLRYVLYDNRSEKVSLKGEVSFMKTYIDLMSIRLPRRVRVNSEFIISENSTTEVAPLIFISLIENAFKHSVSGDGNGFIDIFFEDRVDSGKIVLSISNSNNAKTSQDKSGHGIGLEQVRNRLELLYPSNYSWSITSDADIYKSELIIFK